MIGDGVAPSLRRVHERPYQPRPIPEDTTERPPPEKQSASRDTERRHEAFASPVTGRYALVGGRFARDGFDHALAARSHNAGWRRGDRFSQ